MFQCMHCDGGTGWAKANTEGKQGNKEWKIIEYYNEIGYIRICCLQWPGRLILAALNTTDTRKLLKSLNLSALFKGKLESLKWQL